MAAAGVLVLSACDGEPAPLAESCQSIIDACHDVDMGGEIGECHDTAHDVGTADACNSIEERCLMLCEEAGSTDGGHATDAGH